MSDGLMPLMKEAAEIVSGLILVSFSFDSDDRE